MLLECLLVLYAVIALGSLSAFAGHGAVTVVGLILGGLLGCAAAAWLPMELTDAFTRYGVLVLGGALAGAVTCTLLVGMIRLIGLAEHTVSVLLFALLPLAVVGHDLYWLLQAVEVRDFGSMADAEARAARAGKPLAQGNLARGLGRAAAFAGRPIAMVVDPAVTQVAGATHVVLAEAGRLSAHRPLPLPSVSILDPSAWAHERRMLEAAAREMEVLRLQRLALFALVADEVNARAMAEAKRLEARAKVLPAAWISALR